MAAGADKKSPAVSSDNNRSGNQVYTTSSGVKIKTSSARKAEELSEKYAQEQNTPINNKLSPDFGKTPNELAGNLGGFASEAPTSPVEADLTPETAQDIQAQIDAARGQIEALPQARANATAMANTPVTPANRFQQGLSAAQGTGVAAPQSAGEARGMVSSYLPAEEPSTSVVDDIFSQDPVIGQMMTGIADLLSAKNQVPSIMEDYKRLRRQSGLDDINEELIDAETILDGTEDDIRNEIQTAGGFGTESQVQAMTLSRNKNLLKRYNQLVQMKTDATNQLNTMLTLTQQDRQMAQERINTQISTMFNMANFRQTALQNTRSQYQWMATQMGADGLYNSLSQDPRQLAFAEQILGTGPGGLQKMGEAAAAEKQRRAAIEERQIRATESNAAAAWANIQLERDRLAQEREEEIRAIETAEEAAVAKGEIVLSKVTDANNMLSGITGGALSSGFAGGILKKFGGTQAKDLDTTLDTIKAQLAFDELSKMRAASPTGGALGNVTERELQLLSATASSLDSSQSPSSLKKSLATIQSQYITALNKMGYGVTTTGEVVPIPQ